MMQELNAAAELVKKFPEVQQALINVQREALDLLDQNRQLRERVEELERLRNIEQSLVFSGNFFWSTENPETDPPEEGSGPFCSGCWDIGKKLIHLHGFNNGEHFGCPGCGMVRDRKGDPAHGGVVSRFNVDREMGRPSGGGR